MTNKTNIHKTNRLGRMTLQLPRIAKGLLLAAATVVFATMPAALHAQSTNTADILGNVTDPTGAAVPNVTVTLTNLGTQDTRTVTTDNSGAYTFSSLIPGNYKLSLQAQGFQTLSVPSATVAAGDRRRLDEQLVVGGTSETIEVKGLAPTLQTDSSAVASTVTEKAVQDLPLNGRNYVQLVQITPGANEGGPNGLGSGNRPDDRRQSSSVSANGQADVINNNLIDGMDNNERFIGTIGVRPSIDAIAEVRVLTNNYSADTGRAAGAVVNIVTKSGTNNFHGSLYEYLRNDALNAYPFQFGAHNPKPELRQNQFGGSLGGPIWKDRTFFFGDAEIFRRVDATLPSSAIVPTAYERNNPGDFSDRIPSNCASGNASLSGYTVGSGRVNPNINPSAQIAGCVYDKFSGQWIANNIVPVNQRDPAGIDYLQLYPLPNGGSTASPTYTGSRGRYQYSTVFDIRVDHKISDKDSIFGRYSSNDVSTLSATSPLPIANVAGLAIDPQNGYAGVSPQIAKNAQLNYTRLFTQQLLMNLAASWLFVNNTSNPLNFGTNPNTAFGMPNINVGQSTSSLAPVTPTGYQAIGNGGTFLPLQEKDNVYQLAGSVLYSKGNHSFKAGANVIRRIFALSQSSSNEGTYTFATGLTGLASGTYSAVTRNYSLYNQHYQVWESGFFVQDDWHVAKNLTFNMGVRYDIFTPFTEQHNSISNFDLATATIVQAGINGVSRTADVKTDYSNIAPRFGFAYTVTPKTVIRGGYGIAFFPGNFASPANLKNQPNIAIYGACSWVQAANNLNSCNSNYTFLQNGLPLPLPANPAHLTGSIPAAEDFGYSSSYLHQTNFAVQQDVFGNTVTVAYVGQFGKHIPDAVGDINRAAPNTLGATAGQTLRRFYSVLPNVSTIAQNRSDGASTYNALQVSLERRFTRGLGYNASFTHAHNLDNVSSISGGGGGGNSQVLATKNVDDYGNSDLDQRNRAVAAINYALPGRQLKGIAAILGKDWQANLIEVWSTGLPTNPVNGSNISNTSPGGAADRPNRVFSVDPFGAPNRGINNWVLKSAYVQQPAGTLGTTHRNQVFGPNFRHLDISVFKGFDLTERLRLQFRAELYNVANQASFANPNMTLTASNFGTITSTNVNYQPRLAQFALRLDF